MYALPTLTLAWQRVKDNKGVAGIDRVSIERFEANANYYLQEIHHTLKNQTYRPNAVKRVYIPKWETTSFGNPNS